MEKFVLDVAGKPAASVGMGFLFRQDKNRVKIETKGGLQHCPSWAVDPVDGETLDISNFSLLVDNKGNLGVNVGTKELPNIITPMEVAKARTLFSCFMWAFALYFNTHKKHVDWVDSSWYKAIEEFAAAEAKTEPKDCENYM